MEKYGNIWKKYGKTIGKYGNIWKKYGKTMGKYGKTLGKSDILAFDIFVFVYYVVHGV